MTNRILSVTAALVLALPGDVSAQGLTIEDVNPGTDQQVTGYRGLTRTPPGGLPQLLTNTQLGLLQNGASLVGRYGFVRGGMWSEASNNFAISTVLPVGLGSSFSLTGGVSTLICPSNDACDPRLLLGAGGDVRIFTTRFGTAATSPSFITTVAGELGWAGREDGSFFSGAVTVPLTLVQRGRGMQFAGYVTPGFGFAREAANGRDGTGSRTMLGGGVGIYNTENSVMVNAGFNYVFISEAEFMIGIGLSIGGR